MCAAITAVLLSSQGDSASCVFQYTLEENKYINLSNSICNVFFLFVTKHTKGSNVTLAFVYIYTVYCLMVFSSKLPIQGSNVSKNMHIVMFKLDFWFHTCLNIV